MVTLGMKMRNRLICWLPVIVMTVFLSVSWFADNSRAAHPETQPHGQFHKPASGLVEYIIVTNRDWAAFQTDVNARIGQGYGPIGGIAVNADGHAVQAMGR